jgi:hypothetical protein
MGLLSDGTFNRPETSMETPIMSYDNRENLKLFASIIAAVCLVVIVPMFGWGIKSFVDFARETDSRLAVLEYNANSGTKYTEEDAHRDLGIIIEKINDHELRIRDIEREKPRS